MLIIVGLAVVVFGCSHHTAVVAPSITDRPLPRAELTPYRLRAGDQISVLFWGNPELNQDLIIRPDGAISLPFVDDVAAAGLTPSELDATLSELYRAELTAPEITIIVRTFTGQDITIGGEVAGPGTFPLRADTTLYEAILQAGGFRDTARRDDVVLIRRLESGERIAAKLNMMPMVTGRDPNADIVLQAGDIIFVPRERILEFTLFIRRYFWDLLPITVVTGTSITGNTPAGRTIR